MTMPLPVNEDVYQQLETAAQKGGVWPEDLADGALSRVLRS